MQDEIASEVTMALEVTLLGGSQADRAIDSRAYVLWLEALYFMNQRGKENYEKSAEALRQAMELQPGYAQAWELLAMVYYQQTIGGFRTREEGYALLMDAIDRALALDSNQAEIWGA